MGDALSLYYCNYDAGWLFILVSWHGKQRQGIFSLRYAAFKKNDDKMALIYVFPCFIIKIDKFDGHFFFYPFLWED